MPAVSIPHISGRAHRKKHTKKTYLKTDLYFCLFSREEHYVNRVLWLFSYLNILSMSQTRTHVVKLNEYITHTITD